jgi:tRNA threonylcarbamoyladenosine biosynthesis protein TsaB
MRILGLDAALSRCSVALLQDGLLLAERSEAGGRGQQSMLALMVAEIGIPALDAVAVSIGPGSFTGLRSAIALAHGLAAGRCPVVGVTVAEALAEELGEIPGRAIWTAIDSRRGRIFLTRGGETIAIDLANVEPPGSPVALAGDAAPDLAELLAGRGADVMLTQARQPSARCVARVAARRLAGALPPLEAQPLYIDPPEAKLPAGGLRPPPAA